MKFIWFIADLHLGNPVFKNTTNDFLGVFSNLPVNLTAIYILGDFFNLWYGDDANEEYLITIKQCLRKITANIPIYLLRGNRDFLLSEQFSEETGVKYINDPYVIRMFEKKFLFTHGDLIYGNASYILIRRWLRHYKLLTFFKKLPLKIRRYIVHKIKSSFNLLRTNRPIVINNNFLTDWLKQYSPDYIIAGHIHQIRIEKKQNTTIITLNDWQKTTQQILEWYENNTWQYRSLK